MVTECAIGFGRILAGTHNLDASCSPLLVSLNTGSSCVTLLVQPGGCS